MLLPGFVAAASGYVLFVGLGDWAGIDSFPLSVPGLPAYDGTHLLDLGLAVVIGVVTAVVVVAVHRMATALLAQGQRRFPLPVLLLGGGLCVGLLAQTADLLGANPADVLFSGQASLPAVVASTSVGTLLVLLVAKAVAYAVSLACGFRGGLIFPAVFLGVGIAQFATIAYDVSPTFVVAAGAAAGFAACTRLLLVPIVMAALLIGSDGLDAVPAAVFATAAAWLVATALAKRQGGVGA